MIFRRGSLYTVTWPHYTQENRNTENTCLRTDKAQWQNCHQNLEGHFPDTRYREVAQRRSDENGFHLASLNSLIRGEGPAPPLGSVAWEADRVLLPALLLTPWMLLPSCQESRAHSPSGCL